MTAATVVFLLLGFILLIGGAEFLVRGASRLAVAIGISPLVVGLTVVAFGTSAPELAVSIVSSYAGAADIALGNVLGSNLFNILVILGISSLIVPLVVAQQLVRFDVPVMIGVSALLYPLAMDGVIGRWDGILLFSGVIAYTVFLIRQSRRETNAAVKLEYEDEFGGDPKGSGTPRNIGLVVIGFVGLTLGSKWLVDSSVTIAQAFGVSELVIGLTVVAVGTSLPEVATSVVAAIRGERDIAVGNVVGSNIFNILCVLGASSMLAPNGINVTASALRFDIPVMIAVAVASLPVFFTNYQISRLNGVVFLLFYAAYMVHMFFSSTGHQALDSYETALFYYVAPLTALTLVIITVRNIQARRAA